MSAEGTPTDNFENVNSASPVEGEAALAASMNKPADGYPQADGYPPVAEAAASTNSSSSNSSSDSTASTNSSSSDSSAEAPATPEPAPEAPATPEPAPEAPATPEAAPVTTSGYVMSAKAKDLQSRRKALLEDMRKEYAAVFGDDKKAPKAKAYQAAGLLTIRERDGEDAYKAKLKEYISANQGKYSGTHSKTSKVVKVPSSAVVLNSPRNVTAKNSRALVISSINTMGASAKELIDNIISTTKALAHSTSGDMTALAKHVTKKASPKRGKKKSRKLSAVAEE